LAVGYASVEGKSGYNDGLSSRRAQAIVDLVRPLVRDGKVQMVFFGETSQFDSSDLSKNRVVELWRIDP
jgi:outer membrane protein OmpA-like peptidoglycan-associated protein